MRFSSGKVFASLICAFCLVVGFTSQATAVLTPLNDDTAFVKQTYSDFLKREVAPDELSNHVNQLTTGANDRSELVDQLLRSSEFQTNIAPVLRLYFTYFLRLPDYGGLMFWINSYQQGMSLDDISDEFAKSPEFNAMYGQLSNQEYVNKMYLNIYDREPDLGGLDFWSGHLVAERLTRGQVMVEFSAASEYLEKSTNQVYIAMSSMGLLQQAPELADYDEWAGLMDQGASGLELVDSLLLSDEYSDRFIVSPGTETSFIDQTTGMGFVLVPGGCYMMGDDLTDASSPVHEVCLDAFYMGKHEVTQAQWLAVMGNNPSNFSGCGLNCPVDNVSYDDVSSFIIRLNARSDRNYRLPTEAEWEYAARSGGKLQSWAGTNDQSLLNDYSWFSGNSNTTTHPVGIKLPNELGLYDMTGNVSEWVRDIYDSNYYSASPVNNPVGPFSDVSGRFTHPYRGGDWADLRTVTHRSSQVANFSGFPSGSYGLRLALPVCNEGPCIDPYLDDLDNDGVSLGDGDCNDLDASISPMAQEVCGNEIDENCDRFFGVCDYSSYAIYEPVCPSYEEFEIVGNAEDSAKSYSCTENGTNLPSACMMKELYEKCLAESGGAYGDRCIPAIFGHLVQNTVFVSDPLPERYVEELIFKGTSIDRAYSSFGFNAGVFLPLDNSVSTSIGICVKPLN